MSEGIVSRGQKTVIRWFQREDVDKRQQWPKHTDPLYSHNDPRPMTPRERDLWHLEHTTNGGYRIFAVDDLYGNLIGWITLRHVNTRTGSSVLGIAVDPSRMGRGYGTDAMVAFLEYYFRDLGFREMRLDVAAFNLRAMRCYEKCGFHYVGQHWTEHPSSAFPPIFSDPRYREVQRYFRKSLLGIEVLYHDMVVDLPSFLRRQSAHRDGQEDEAEAERIPARRGSRR